MPNIVVVAHKYLPHPDDELIVFLRKKKAENLMHIRHSFPEAQDRRSSYTIYKKGEVFKEKKSADYKFLPDILIYLKESFFSIKWVLETGINWQVYIGMDGLVVLFGLILKKFGFVNKVIYWSVDFVPEGRFENALKNRIYRYVNTLGYKKADEVWDLSPRMYEAREKYLRMKKSDYKKLKIVPYGVWLDRIKVVNYIKCQKRTLVFMGHLMPKQGVDMVILNIPNILKKVPEFKLKIIGGGVHKEELINLAKKLKVSKYCEFLGRIENSEKMEKEIAKSALAIAPYQSSLDLYTYYADPGKVKTYLACGVPVLLTEVPWNAKEIEKKGCGMIIAEDGSDLVDKILIMLREDKNQRSRKIAREYAKSFDYKTIFNKLNLA